MNLWNVIDNSPTLYVCAVGFALHVLGQALARRKPELEYWQYAAGAVTFTVLLLRRLTDESPELFIEIVLVMLRSAAFGLIAYGLAGTLGVFVLVLSDMFRRVRWWIDGIRRQRRDRRRRKLMTKHLELFPAPEPPIRDVAAEQAESEKRKREAQKNKAEQRRKQRAKLQSELELMFALDQDRREHFLSLIQSCDDAELPADEYEDRMSMIREAVSRYAPRRTRRFTSLTDLMQYFDGRVAEVENSDADEEEKEHLKAMISMERQQAIGRLMQA